MYGKIRYRARSAAIRFATVNKRARHRTSTRLKREKLNEVAGSAVIFMAEFSRTLDVLLPGRASCPPDILLLGGGPCFLHSCFVPCRWFPGRGHRDGSSPC